MENAPWRLSKMATCLLLLFCLEWEERGWHKHSGNNLKKNRLARFERTMDETNTRVFASLMLKAWRIRIRHERVEKVLTDGSYTGENFAENVKRLIGAEVEVVKRNELHTFTVLPKRWVVERSFSWLEKCRRLWKDCERTLATSLQMTVLAFAVLVLRRF